LRADYPKLRATTDADVDNDREIHQGGLDRLAKGLRELKALWKLQNKMGEAGWSFLRKGE
jgi:hypothetical protein